MSYPILYSPTETDFYHNGIGILSDCVLCEVTEEANGAFELVMQYPMDGIHFESIVDRCIIKAKPNQSANPQLFRVYSTSKPMPGIVSIFAAHISYDLSGITVSPFTANYAEEAMSGLLDNASIDCPFTFRTDGVMRLGIFSVAVPCSIRSRLGGSKDSILDVFGGEYEFDNFDVILHNSRGKNNGVSIRYGKNLTDMKQDRNCDSVYTGIHPYWAGKVDGKQTVVELPEKIVTAKGSHDFVKIKTVDFSEEYKEKPDADELRAISISYIESNNIGVPSVSLSVSFAQLERIEEYKGQRFLEDVNLFDTVNVEFPALGVSENAKAVKVVYDALADRVKSIDLGSGRANISDTIASLGEMKKFTEFQNR